MVDSLPKAQIRVDATQGTITVAKTDMIDLMQAPIEMFPSIDTTGNDLFNDNNEINMEALTDKLYLD